MTTDDIQSAAIRARELPDGAIAVLAELAELPAWESRGYGGLRCRSRDPVRRYARMLEALGLLTRRAQYHSGLMVSELGRRVAEAMGLGMVTR